MSEGAVEPGASIDRRGLLAAGAWAAPILIAVAAAPAASASDSPGLVGLLEVTVQEITESSETGLSWSSATLLYPWSAGGPEAISFTWSAALIRSDGDGETRTEIGSGSDVVAMTGTAVLDPAEDQIVPPPVPAGTYTIVVTVIASDASVRTFTGRSYVISG